MQDYQNSDEPMKIPHPRLIEIDYVRKQMVIKGIFFPPLSFSVQRNYKSMNTGSHQTSQSSLASLLFEIANENTKK